MILCKRSSSLFFSKGFTIIELIMVLLIIGIVSVTIVPNFLDFRDEAKIAVTKDRMQALKTAIVGDNRVVSGGTYVTPGFRQDLGRLPVNLAELVTQGAMATYDPINRSGWRGPYIDTSQLADYSVDSWNTAFVYSTSPPFIRSWGPDRTNNAGGGDDITLTY